MARVSGVAVAGLVGLWVVAGSMGSVDLDKIGPKTKPEAPQTAQGASTAEPSSTPAQDEPQSPPEQLQKADAKAVAEEQRTAALQFFAFYHLNTRIRTAFCANHGVDMTAFASQFRQSQRANHARATAVAAAAGLTEERIFADSRAELNGLIDADMEQLGKKTGMGAAGGCRLMVRHADKFVPGIDFAKVMPDAHRALMGASRT